MNEPDALCGAPGRDADADVTCDLAPHGPQEQHHGAYFGPFFRRVELEWPDPEPAAVLRIVAQYVTESHTGGPAAGDLVARLEAAGYTLPDLPRRSTRMNLPGDTIDVGTTRAPGVPTHPVTAFFFDSAFLADPDRFLPMVADWTREELYAVANVLFGEGARRNDAELLALLRSWNPTWEGSEPDAVKAEFVTDSNGGSVRWSQTSYYVHHADGSAHEFKFPEEGEDNKFAAQDKRFTELLATRSGDDLPVHGAHLFVDLKTGVFTVEGPHAI
ncbi:hypothetical protein [Streptomyces microflavus]|uniref:hypothetical protein n=1 Tax=Streptomyces microflavus TaxID=1919 RepID=UPI003663A66A